MPTVKNYTRSVETRPLPAVRSDAALSPAAAGAGIGQVVQAFGAQLYQDELLRQDQVAFLEADRKLSEWENKALYDPRNGALTRRGKDAFGLPDEIGKAYTLQVEEVRKGLNTERQRVAYDRAVEARRKDINTTLSRHVFTESRKFEEAETENYVLNAQQAAISNFQDPERVALELERARAAVAGFARRNGMGPEYEKQKTAQILSNTTVGIIERYLANGNDRTAEQYFKANKSLIAGDDVTKVEAKLQIAKVEGEGLRGAVAVWEKLGPKTDLDPVNLDAMIKEAEATYADDTKLLKAVKQGLVERANVHNAAQRERAEAAGSAVWQAIEKGAGLAQVRRMPEFLALPGKAREEIKVHIINRARSDQAHADAHGGNEALYYQLITEASSPELRDQFARRNLLDDRPKLSKTQWNHLVEIQAATRKGDTKATDKLLASERQQNAMVNEALISMKLDPTPNEKTSPSKVEQIVGFRRSVREAVQSLELRQGKNATDEQVQAIVDGLVIEGVTKKRTFWTDETKRVFQLKPGESISIKATDVPKSERTKIEAALRANGRAVTDQAVTELYRQKLLRMRGTLAEPEGRGPGPKRGTGASGGY